MGQKKEDHKSSEEAKKHELKGCFVIMPIADQPGYDPGHFDRVYDYIIKPACEELGFRPTRADHVRSSNLIMIDILKRILNADLAICDLSARNPNVLYELAVRQCFGLPVVLIKDSITVEPFDSSGIRYSQYNKELRIDLVAKAKEDLKASISSTIDNKDSDVFSLLEVLGRDKASVKPTSLSPEGVALLEAFEQLSRSVTSNIGQPVKTSSIATVRPPRPNVQIVFYEPIPKLTADQIIALIKETYGDYLLTGGFVLKTDTKGATLIVQIGLAFKAELVPDSIADNISDLLLKNGFTFGSISSHI